MRFLATLLSLSALLSASATAQDILAVDNPGEVFLVDSTTGSGFPIGHIGFPGVECLARNSRDQLFTLARYELLLVDPLSGIGMPVLGTDVFEAHGFAFLVDTSGAETPYLIEKDSLYELDLASGRKRLIGMTGFADIEGLAQQSGRLYGWSSSLGLLAVDHLSGAAHPIGLPSPWATYINGLDFSPSGVLHGMGKGLYTIDLTTGDATRVGTGFGMIRGIAFLDGSSGPRFSVANLVAGATCTLELTNAQGNAWFCWSVAGAGPTTTPYGFSLDLSMPISSLGPYPVDPTGTASTTMGVPMGTTGIHVWLQAVDQHPTGFAVSNPEAKTIG